MIGISLNSVADDRWSSLRLVVAVVVIGTSLNTVETKGNVLEVTGEEMETSFRGMLEGSTGMAGTSFFEVSSPNRDSENFLRKKKEYCNLQPWRNCVKYILQINSEQGIKYISFCG